MVLCTPNFGIRYIIFYSAIKNIPWISIFKNICFNFASVPFWPFGIFIKNNWRAIFLHDHLTEYMLEINLAICITVNLNLVSRKALHILWNIYSLENKQGLLTHPVSPKKCYLRCFKTNIHIRRRWEGRAGRGTATAWRRQTGSRAGSAPPPRPPRSPAREGHTRHSPLRLKYHSC